MLTFISFFESLVFVPLCLSPCVPLCYKLVGAESMSYLCSVHLNKDISNSLSGALYIENDFYVVEFNIASLSELEQIINNM